MIFSDKTKRKKAEKVNQTRKKNKKATDYMEEFKVSGISTLEQMSESQLNNVVHEANKQYHAYQTNKCPPILSDSEFDIIKEFLEINYPDASSLQETGAEVSDKLKVELPINMPSMDKIKPDTNALIQWMEKYKGPYIISCKLDGVSGLYYTLENKQKLFTRGNGKVGQDISHLLKSIKIPKVNDVIIRGEFIILKKTFDEKYKNDFANTRNMVAGIVNKKNLDKKAKDVHFIAYEVIEPVLKPSEQMKYLTEHGFETVQNHIQANISNEYLSNLLIEWRKNYEYEIDGIIVSDDDIHVRLEGNPEHAFAFKMVISDQIAETHVTDVIWTASKDGYLKPRVRVNPVNIGGVKIEYTTGFNGQYIESNKIGIGAVIQIVRSGDVIPYIKNVTSPAETAKMPDVPFIWTDTHVDVMLANTEDDPTVLEKKITTFFSNLNVDGLSSGNTKRLVTAGYNTIPKIIHMEEEQFLEIEGFREKMAKKVHGSIQNKIQTTSLVKIISSSNTLGRGIGEKKIKPIFAKYPNILTSGETSNEKIHMLTYVDGIGKENAKTFVENIPHVLKFLTECNLMQRLNIDIQNTNMQASTNTIKSGIEEHPLFKKRILFTGVRDKPLMAKLEEEYKVTFPSTVNKNTDIIIVKMKNDSNKKIEEAKKRKLPMFTLSEFKEEYKILVQES